MENDILRGAEGLQGIQSCGKEYPAGKGSCSTSRIKGVAKIARRMEGYNQRWCSYLDSQHAHMYFGLVGACQDIVFLVEIHLEIWKLDQISPPDITLSASRVFQSKCRQGTSH